MAANPLGAHQVGELSLADNGQMGCYLQTTAPPFLAKWTVARAWQSSIAEFYFGIRGD